MEGASRRLMHHLLKRRLRRASDGSLSIPPQPISLTRNLLYSSKDETRETTFVTEVRDVGATPPRCESELSSSWSAASSTSSSKRDELGREYDILEHDKIDKVVSFLLLGMKKDETDGKTSTLD